MDFFHTDPPLRAADLPCLVLFPRPEDRRAIVRSIPEWSEDEVFEFLGGVIDEVVDSLDMPAAQRMEHLTRALTSPNARARRLVDHYSKHVRSAKRAV